MLNEAGKLIANTGSKALIVTGRESTKKSGALQSLTDSMIESGIEEILLYDKIFPNPSYKVVDAGAEIACKQNVDLIVGIGGGSSLDAAKAIALVSASRGSSWDYVNYPEGSVRKPEKSKPLVCIPTTAGTGSEVNRYAVINNPEKREKMVISHSLCYPKIAVIDPLLTLSMSRELTAITGFDALIHALEALTNRVTNKIAQEFAVKAIKLIGRWLPIAVFDPQNLEAREKMSYASMLAGIAIDQMGVALIHAMEHPISGHFPEIPHGKGLSALAVAVTEFNVRGNPEGYALFSRLMGYENTPLGAIKALEDFIEFLKLPKNLKSLGLKEDSLEILAKDVVRLSDRSLRVNPVEVTEKDILQIYKRAYFS